MQIQSLFGLQREFKAAFDDFVRSSLSPLNQSDLKSQAVEVWYCLQMYSLRMEVDLEYFSPMAKTALRPP